MEKKSRITIDMPSDEHSYLKMACAKLGISMREFMVRCAFEKIQEMEDEWLAAKADQIIDEIESGKRKVISWEEMIKRLDK